MSDFYIGYLPQAPAALARRTKVVVISLIATAAALALLFVLAQSHFPASTFEFQHSRDLEGVVAMDPYPTLLVPRPGDASSEPSSHYLLVGQGKHGADLSSFEGKRVRLRGELIDRDGHTMVQVQPGSVTVLDSAAAATLATEDFGEVTLRGEIVDSKCYLGVMNPGRGKVHRECAARCISGGLPPALILSAPVHGERFELLADPNGHPLRRELLPRVAEPVTLRGHLVRIGADLIFKTSAGS